MVSVTAWWDPAYGSPNHGDASVVAAVFTDTEGGYWLHDIRYLVHNPALRDEIDEATQLCRQVGEFAHELHLPALTVETNGLGRFLPAVLQREINALRVGCKVLEHVSRKSKDQRILDALDPVLAAGALRAHSRIWQSPFISEMRDWRPGRSGRDDGLDAVSSCILAEPVRLKRFTLDRRPDWRQSSNTSAVEVDFVP